MKTYPLLQSQMGVFLEWLANPEMTQYNLPFIIPVTSSVDTDRMVKAVERLVEARPEMKMRYVMEAGEVRQYIDPDIRIQMEVKQMPEAEVQAYFTDSIRPYDLLAGEPLWRFELIETEVRKYFFMDCHHIMADGTSICYTFFPELNALYKGEQLPLREKNVLDYAEVETASFASEAYQTAKAFQCARFGEVSLMSLAQENSDAWGRQLRCSAYLPIAEVESCCKTIGTKGNRLLMAAFSYVMSVLSREEKIAYTTVRSGRTDEQMKHVYGMFVKTMPILADANRCQRVSDFIRGFRDELVSAIQNDIYPFTHFCQDLGQKPGVLFAFQGNDIQEDMDFCGEATRFTLMTQELTAADLSVIIYIQGNQYEIRVEASEKLHSEAYLQMVAEAVKTTALHMMAHPEDELGSISIIGEEQEAALEQLADGGKLDFDRSETLVDLFRKQVTKTPDSIAVVYKDRRLTYREVDELTDRLAVKLHTLGVGPEQAVGVMIDRSELMLVYPMAIMKAGAAYMPLDSHFPEDRLTFMCQDAGVRLILADDGLVQQALPAFDGILFQQSELAALPAVSAEEVTALPKATPQNMFVILYTSGSTGKPKGCMLEHHNIVNFCHWYVEAFNMTADDRAVAYANFGFDAHMMDLYPTLSVGACVHILASDIRLDLVAMGKYIEENELTIAFMTTQIGYLFATSIENHSLRLLSVGGEKLPPIQKPPYRFYNGYGPTECTLFSTYYNIETGYYDSSYIGRPLAGYRLYVVDKYMKLVPQGVPGELVVTGEGVGRGYLNRPEMNTEKFITFRGEKAYRTGDLVRWSPDGNIDFMGRMDNQVKLRGLRIELGEIEARASQLDGIRTVCVDVKEIAGTQNLVCYYCEKEGMSVSPEELKTWLAETLSDFMVPEIYMKLDTLPFTPNGKVNRRALPIPEVEVSDIVAPETETEKQLFALAAEVLKHDKFGVTTNLISVGMTSLLAMRLSAVVQQSMGVVLKVKELMSTPLIRELALRLEGEQDAVSLQSEKSWEKRKFYPLNTNQRGLYIEWEMNREALQYNIPSVQAITGVDAESLRKALVEVVNAHPSLKTRLSRRDGEVVQLRRDDAPVEVSLTELGEEPEEGFFQGRVRPFDLFNDTLYRLEIFRTPHTLYLFKDIHHIIFDGSSDLIFMDDLAKALEGKTVEAESYTAFDYALDEQVRMKSDAYADAERYFDTLLADFAVASYPHDALPDTDLPGSGKMEIVVSGENIARFCRQNAVTENSFFLTVTTQVLHRILREESLLISSITSGRDSFKLGRTEGMFVKTLPVVTRMAKGSVADTVKGMQQQYIETQENALVPYATLVERYAMSPQFMFVYEGGVVQENGAKTLALDTVKMPVSVLVFSQDSDYLLQLEYDTSLYHSRSMQQLGEALKCFAEQAASDAEVACSDIPLLPAKDMEQVIALSKGADLYYDTSETFVDCVVRQGRERPEAIAVVDKVGELTYAELNSRSDALATQLLALGVKPNAFVALMLPRRMEFLVAVLGVQKAGAAYVPMDSDYPNDRLLYMLEDSEANVLITTRELYERKCKEGDFSAANVLFIEEEKWEVSDVAFTSRAVPDGLAYMIYTSGSTGRPKGVMLPHRALRAFVAWRISALDITHESRHAAHASFSFDASLDDLLCPLAAGGTVCILSESLRKDMDGMYRYFKEKEITGLTLSTAMGMAMLNQYPDLPLAFLMMGGEKMLSFPKTPIKVINGYGPTEFSVCSSYHVVNQDKDVDIPIGRPVPNSYSFICDPAGLLLPMGMAGELCLCGVQMAMGYWHREELSRERFCDCPFMPGRKMYRTGDLARYNDEGELEFLGRIDNQVKLRGFRIEMGEIENAASQFEGVNAVAAEVKTVGALQHLCLYYSTNQEVDKDSLQGYLASKLTDYMVPTVYMEMPELPMTPNGKVNRKALPLPQITSGVEYVEPANEAERQFCDIFAQILKVERIGATDNFFDLGGSSLAVMRIIVEADKAGYTLAYKEVFSHPTPRALAQFVSGGEAEADNKFSEITDYDYTALEEVLQANTLDNFRQGERQALGNVLLTGATGYLGIHILKELLESGEGHIYCLVRGNKSQTAEHRLKTLLFYYFESTFDEAFNSRITLVSGDVTQPEVFAALKEEPIQTVINCAAVVKHFSQGTEIEDVNVGGVKNLIAFCLSTDASLIHVSTVSVAGMSVDGQPDPRTLFSERMLYFGQSVDNQYIHSKFLAERLILENIGRNGLNAKIMRVGNLSARNTDGEFQINFNTNSFMGRLKVFRMLGVCAYDGLDGAVEFSPIDETARAILLLATTPRACIVFHPYNSHTELMGDIFAEMGKLGLPVEAVEPERFYEALDQAKADPAKAQTLSSLIAYVTTGKQMMPIDANNQYTLQVLHRLGYSWPYTSWDYISRFLLALKGLGFFAE